MKYLLGINLSHDASAALLDQSGKVLFAVSEERLSRIKNHSGIPRRAIDFITRGFHSEIAEVVIGSDINFSSNMYNVLSSQISGSPSAKEGQYYPREVPGHLKPLRSNMEARIALQDLLVQFANGRIAKNSSFFWERHHDSHIGCALTLRPNQDSLLISLDGSGDGESGAIANSNSHGLTYLSRFSNLDSLGNLYSSVTQRYNFKPQHHEGKITGLAAHGQYSGAVDVLLKYVEVIDGIPRIRNIRGLKSKFIRRAMPLNVSRKFMLSIDDIIDKAENESHNYSNLAFAVQYVLEQSVLEIAKYWQSETHNINLSLAGGVFANVKLNQKLAEELPFESVRVFPNMGDGGISIGGVWSHLSKSQSMDLTAEPFENMYLGPYEEDAMQVYELNRELGISYKELPRLNLVKHAANSIANGKLVGIHYGNFEFGPRALGHRSILIDPRRRELNDEVNSRLRRTEFMPFAPAVLSDHAQKYFDLQKMDDTQPFKYMAMTCKVRHEVIAEIPGVVHIDGTARPQIVSQSEGGFYWEIIEAFYSLTGLPVVVNTSFNVHEEPINTSLSDSISALRRNSVDIIYTESGYFQLSSQQ